MGQHFVPQHYLRQFRIGDSPCVAVAQVEPYRWIGQASIRGQCQHGEFYGKNSPLDGLYKEIESSVAPALRDVAAKLAWEREELFALRMLAVSLHLRTKKAIEPQKVFHRMIADRFIKTAIDKGELPEPEGGWRSGLIDFKGAPADLGFLTIQCDLESATLWLKLLSAPDGAFFITSDHPVIAMNQFAAGANTGRGYVGFAKAGFQLLLPLSPRVTAIFYDPTVYKVGGRNDTCVPLSLADVEMLNSFQIQAADKCVFCHDTSLAKTVETLCARYAKLRVNPAEMLKQYKLTSPGQTLIHHQHGTVRAIRPLSFVSQLRNVKAKPGADRDAIHSELVNRLMDDIRTNPFGGDLETRQKRVFAEFERSRTGTR